MSSFEQSTGLKMTINSGYRSTEHNKKVGGAKHSQHLGGNAVDFSVPSGKYSNEELKQKLYESGFTTVGIISTHSGKVHIHADRRDLGGKKRELVYENGRYKSARDF